LANSLFTRFAIVNGILVKYRVMYNIIKGEELDVSTMTSNGKRYERYLATLNISLTLLIQIE